VACLYGLQGLHNNHVNVCVPSLPKSKGTSRLVSQEMREKQKKKRKMREKSMFSPNAFLIQTNAEQGDTEHTLHSTTESLDATVNLHHA
jgi:hypothetical protein